MRSFALTDIGKKREDNEDYVFRSEEPVGCLPNLFIVADGMGGHNAGDFASRFCVEEFTALLREKNEKTVYSTLDSAFRETNEKLIQQARERSDLDGMGTTFVMAYVQDGVLHVANIGDSRLYLVRSEIEQITMDHSLVAEMVRNGEINEEMARFHPNKNIVTRAISTNGIVVPDYYEVPLLPNDTFMLCSDGLYSMVENKEIFDIIKNHPSDEQGACEELIEKANQNGGKDNISVIIVSLK